MHIQERLKANNDWRTMAPLKVKTFDASATEKCAYRSARLRRRTQFLLSFSWNSRGSLRGRRLRHRATLLPSPGDFDSSSRGETVKAAVGKAALA
jgi:hypothetical protein